MIILLIIFLSAVVLIHPQGNRVGDGSEYYSMLINLGEGFHPYSTPETIQEYDKYITHSKVRGFVGSNILKDYYKFLTNDKGEMDYNHFWFYSLCASVFYHPFKLLGIDVGQGFTWVHVILMVLVGFIARRKFGDLGLLAFLLILATSPLIWFINKAHTEFFTFVLFTGALIYLLNREIMLSALFCAVLSTQNPPFAVISLALLCIGFFADKDISIRKRLVLAFITVFFFSIHPLYYLARYGVLTPQLLYGISAKPPAIRTMTLWLIDPDIGLLPNYPFLILVMAVSLFRLGGKRLFRLKRLWIGVFYLIIIVFFAYSQSKTININSGATVHVSRYALWYIPLAFPLIMTVFTKSGKVLWIATLLLIALNYSSFKPPKSERYVSQTKFSRMLYKYLPGIYDQHPEIFIERSVNREYDIYNMPDSLWAVCNRTKTKILIDADIVKRMTASGTSSEGSCGCVEIPDKNALIQEALKTDKMFFYKTVPGEMKRYNPYIPGTELRFSSTDSDRYFCDGGMLWDPEPWGRWTRANDIILNFSIQQEIKDGYSAFIEMTAGSFTYPGLDKHRFEVTFNGETIGTLCVAANPEVFRLEFPASLIKENNKLEIRLLTKTVSPAKISNSPDTRNLGLGLISIKLDLTNNKHVN
jgi:hypothetical protein